MATFVIRDYIPRLDWLSQVNGWHSRAQRVPKEFDEFLDEVVEDHINKGSTHESCDNKDSDGLNDFVDVLLWAQKAGSLGFQVDRTVIKAMIMVRISMLPSHFLILQSSN